MTAMTMGIQATCELYTTYCEHAFDISTLYICNLAINRSYITYFDVVFDDNRL